MLRLFFLRHFHIDKYHLFMKRNGMNVLISKIIIIIVYLLFKLIKLFRHLDTSERVCEMLDRAASEPGLVFDVYCPMLDALVSI